MNMFDKAVLALPGIRGALAVVCAAALVRAFLAVGQAFFLARAVVALWEGAAIASQAATIAAFLACFLGLQLVLWAQDAWVSRYAAARADELRQQLLGTLFSKGPQVVASQGTGNVSAACIEGIANVEDYLKLTLPKLASLLVVPLVLIVFAFAFDWVSGVIMLIAFPTIVMFMILIGYNAEDAAAKRYKQFTVLSNHFVDSLRGLDTLKAFGRSRAHGATIFKVSERFREATMSTLRIAILSSAVLDLAATLALAAVAIMLGFRLVEGGIAFFPALFVLILTPEYFKPIREFAADYHATLDGKTALASINELIAQGAGDAAGDAEGGAAANGEEKDTEGGSTVRAATSSSGDTGERSAGGSGSGAAATSTPSAYGGTNGSMGAGSGAEGEATTGSGPRATATGGAGTSGNAFCGPAAASTPQPATAPAPLEPWGPHSTLKLANVGFAYPGHQALQGITLAAQGCQRIGVVGASGSGKSTLISLLAGFLEPGSGQVAVQGRQLASLHTPGWQGQALYIPQNPYLFHTSLRSNIAFYTPGASEQAIQRAVRLVGLDALVAELPDGLDTVVGEGARALSGGERQRVALARALLDDTRKVLLFDEPTAHLDIQTELELKERMLPVMEGRLVFFATHRLHWVAQMDAVAVLEEGRLAQFGTPAQLTAEDGPYRRLAARLGGEL